MPTTMLTSPAFDSAAKDCKQPTTTPTSPALDSAAKDCKQNTLGTNNDRCCLCPRYILLMFCLTNVLFSFLFFSNYVYNNMNETTSTTANPCLVNVAVPHHNCLPPTLMTMTHTMTWCCCHVTTAYHQWQIMMPGCHIRGGQQPTTRAADDANANTTNPNAHHQCQHCQHQHQCQRQWWCPLLTFTPWVGMYFFSCCPQPPFCFVLL